MNYQTIISAADLKENLYTPDWMILDLRSGVSTDRACYQAFKEGHIPNAFYCCFSENYSSSNYNDKPSDKAPISASDPDKLIASLEENGFNQDSQIVIYDDKNESNSISNNMWLFLRTSHCQNVAVLQGGFNEWLKQKMPLNKIEEIAYSESLH